MSKLPASMKIRWVTASLVGGFGFYELGYAFFQGLSYGVFGNIMLGLGALFVALLLVGTEVVGWALLPLTGLLDRLLLPSESEPPPAAFKLARYYAGLLRHEEACEEYAKIVRYHPEETDAYLEGIREAFLAGNEAAAKKFFRAAQRYLRAPHERQLLESMYAAGRLSVSLPAELEVLDAEPSGGAATE